MKYYISAPFGNHLTRPNMHSVMGTFTLYPRSGLFKQIIKTLRYDFDKNGWTNNIGLRNPGIYTGVQKYHMNPRKKVISIRGMNQKEWIDLAKITKGMRIELNLSCPNTPDKRNNVDCPIELFDKEVIVKMSPLTTEKEIVNLIERGVRRWHFSNTLPIRLSQGGGGLSGKSLMVYNKKLIKFVLGEDKGAKIIGGGGVTNMSDVRFYKDLGCIGVSLGSVCFWPFALKRFT